MSGLPPAIPVARPQLPAASAIQPYLHEIDTNAWYSNYGPLSVRLQSRLAAHWGVADQNVTLLTNATSAITLTLLASGAKPGTRCLMPSWTFVASAGAVVAAGLQPYFVDVLPSTWAPDPSVIERLARLPEVGAILIVAPFGAPLDLAVWDDVQRRTGVPLVIDAAAAFDTLRADGPMPAGQCPVVVSLHATKVFGVGEGGALLARDADLIQRVRALAQFGFAGSRLAQTQGVNAKISEYTAAVGLAGLDTWAETRDRWDRVTQRYCAELPEAAALAPRFGRGWVASTLTLLLPDDDPTVADTLARDGVTSLSWWGLGCHVQPAYAHCARDELPVTQIYARRAIGIPFWQAMTNAQISTVCSALKRSIRPRARTRQAGRTLVSA